LRWTVDAGELVTAMSVERSVVRPCRRDTTALNGLKPVGWDVSIRHRSDDNVPRTAKCQRDARWRCEPATCVASDGGLGAG